MKRSRFRLPLIAIILQFWAVNAHAEMVCNLQEIFWQTASSQSVHKLWQKISNHSYTVTFRGRSAELHLPLVAIGELSCSDLLWICRGERVGSEGKIYHRTLTSFGTYVTYSEYQEGSAPTTSLFLVESCNGQP